MEKTPEFNLQLFGVEDVPGANPEPQNQEPSEQIPEHSPGQEENKPEENNPEGNKQDGNKQDGTLLGGDPEQVNYDFSSIIPEGVEFNQEALAQYTDLAKMAGLSPELANKIGEFGIDLQQKAYQAAVDQRVAEIKGWEETTRQELGNTLDATMTDAAKGLNVLEKTIPTLRQALNETGAGNRVEFVKMMALVGKLVSEENGMNLLAGIAGGSSSGANNIYNNTDWSKY